MGKIEIKGRLIGVFQDETGFFARFESEDGLELHLPLTTSEFHGLVFRPAILTLEIK
jgi:hypothetical protein